MSSPVNQTKQIATAIREWLDANNHARETGDPIAAARTEPALKAVAQWIVHVKQGHARVPQGTMPLLLTIDIMIALSSHVNPMYAASRPLAHSLVRLLRATEEDIREKLAAVTGAPVPPRSTAHDAVEDALLEKAAPVVEPPQPQLKLVLS